MSYDSYEYVPGYNYPLPSNSIDLSAVVPSSGNSFPLQRPIKQPLSAEEKRILKVKESNSNASFLFQFPIPEDKLVPSKNQREALRINKEQVRNHVVNSTKRAFGKVNHSSQKSCDTLNSKSNENANNDFVCSHSSMSSQFRSSRVCDAQDFGGHLEDILVTPKERARQRMLASEQQHVTQQQPNRHHHQSTDNGTIKAKSSSFLNQSTRNGNAALSDNPEKRNSTREFSHKSVACLRTSEDTTSSSCHVTSSPSYLSSSSLPSSEITSSRLSTAIQRSSHECWNNQSNVSIKNQSSNANDVGKDPLTTVGIESVTRTLYALMSSGVTDISDVANQMGLSLQEAETLFEQMHKSMSFLLNSFHSSSSSASSSSSPNQCVPSEEKHVPCPDSGFQERNFAQNSNVDDDVPAEEEEEVVLEIESSDRFLPHSAELTTYPGGRRQFTSHQQAQNRRAVSSGVVVAPYAWLGNLSNGAPTAAAAPSGRRMAHGNRSGTALSRSRTVGASAQDWEISDFSYENLLELGSMAVTVGLTKQQISRLPTYVFDKKSAAHLPVDCSICLESFELSDNCLLLVCGHGFHPSCITPWLLRSKQCPCCRHDVGRSNAHRRS